MAVEDRIVIHVEIDVDALGDLAKVTAAMKAIEAQEKRLNTQTNVMERHTNRLDRTTTKLSKTLNAVGNAFASLFRITNKFNFIGMAADIAFVSVALAGVKLALIAGRFAAKAYSVTLQALGVAAAGAAAAIGTVAAALSEFQQVSLMPFVGSFRAASSAVRGVMGDSLLSFFGMEGLTGAIQALAQSGEVAAATFPSVLRGLGNFARDGKQLAQLAEIFSTITAEGKVTQSTFNSLVGVNPVFASAIAELSSGKVLQGDAARKIAEGAAETGKISAEEFSKVFTGELESTNLWEGQLERLNNTLFGQIKGLIVRVGSLFVDFGKPFLDPIREVIADIETITTNTLTRLRRVVTQFGIQSFVPGLLSAFQKLSDFIVKMANEGLPKLTGSMDKVRKFFDSTENFFRNIGAILKPLEHGADVMMSVFGPFLRGIFGAKGLGGLIMGAADEFSDNADAMEKMAQALGDFAFSFMGIFRDLQDSFFSGSDTIADFFTILSTDVMPVIREILQLFRSMWREALPTINRLLKETSEILLPILKILEGIVASFGGLGAAALFGLVGARKGGLSGPMMAGAGLGGAMGGLPGAVAGYGLTHLASKFIKGRGGMGAMLGMGTKGGQMALPFGGLGGLGARASAAGLTGASFGVPAVAGGFGGYMTGKFLEERFKTGTGASAGAGAAVGAGAGVLGAIGTGALLGTAAGPVGIAVGAIIGAIAGGIAAAFASKGVQETRVKAGEWIEEQMDAVTGEIGRALDKGANRQALKDARDIMKEMLSPSNVKSMAEQLKLTEKETRTIIEEATAKYEKEITKREGNLDESLSRIGDIFDMTSDQILDLADLMAVDLSDSLTTFMSDLQNLGLLVDNIGEASLAIGEDSALMTVFGPESVLGKGVAKSQAAGIREEIDALLDTIKATESAGDLGAIPGQITDLLNMVVSVGQLEYGERGVEVLFRIHDALAELSDPTSTAYVGGVTGQTAQQSLQQNVDPEIKQIIEGTHPLYQPLKDSLAAMLAQTDNPEFLWENYFADRIIPEVERRGGFQNIQRVLEDMSPEVEAMTFAITDSSSQFHSSVLDSANYFSTTMIASAEAAGRALARQALVDAGEAPTGHGHGTPSTPTPSGGTVKGRGSATPWRNSRDDPTDDTATSRFGRVLNFHSALSSRLGGGFGITSGIRDYNLGSGSSDHLSGRAIDLVGNNLGQYAKAVQGMGGFAEFHGNAGSRHLHAVPPVGDTATPSLAGASKGGTMMSLEFNINGAQDPKAVADEVMKEINKVMRDEDERR